MSKVEYGLRSIEIENFRGIDSLKLNFEDVHGGVSDIVVIAGPNGCGKTTVLEACLHFTDAIGQVRGPVGKPGVRLGASHYRLGSVLQVPRGVVQAEYTTVKRKQISYWVDTLRQTAKSLEGHIPGLSFVQALYVSSFRASRLVGALPISLKSSSPEPRSGEADRLKGVKQYLISAKAFEALGGDAVDSSRTFRELTKRLIEVWRIFFPDPATSFDVQPVGPGPEDDFDLYLLGPSGRIPVDALSSGQLELVTLFGTLLRLEKELHVLVIDEPELHLDPQWHAPLLNAIRKLLPTTQIIVGTHSPIIYDSVLSFQRHFLVPDDDPRAKTWNLEEAESAQQ